MDLDEYLQYSDKFSNKLKQKSISTYNAVMATLILLGVIRRILG